MPNPNAVEVDDSRADIMASIQELSGAPDDNRQQEEVATEEPEARSGPARDASGRFAPQVPSKDTAVPDGEQAGEKPEVDPDAEPEKPAEGEVKTPVVDDPTDRAPVSWKPTEREHWKGASPELKAAVRRREQEIDTALRATADARRFQQAFVDVVRPYEQMIVAENTNFLAATQNLFQTAQALRHGSPQQKAQMVAQMINQFAVDIPMLDDFLSQTQQRGYQPPQQQPQDIERMIQQGIERGLAPFRQQAQQQTQEEVQADLDAFMNDPKNEFINDVGPIMADILMAAANRKEKMDLQTAYTRATLAHPEVASILEKRRASTSVAQQNAAAQRARNASVSVSGTGAPQGGTEVEDDGSVRSAIMASVAELSKASRL